MGAFDCCGWGEPRTHVETKDRFAFVRKFLDDSETYPHDQIGEGSFGSVYKVTVPEDENRTYAVKIAKGKKTGYFHLTDVLRDGKVGMNAEEVRLFVLFYAEWLVASNSRQDHLVRGLAFRTDPVLPASVDEALRKYLNKGCKVGDRNEIAALKDIVVAMRPAFPRKRVDVYGYIVMEYFKGTSLKDWMKSQKAQRRPHRIFAKIAFHCLSAMVEVHRMFMVHSDVKPGNFLLSTEAAESTRSLNIEEVAA